jgi:Helix-turn-helix domain of resolvase
MDDERTLYLTSENMNYLHIRMNHERIEYRRDRVIELYSEGRNRSTIAKTLRLSRSTVKRDIRCRMQETKNKMRLFYDEKLPFEHELFRIGLDKILEKTWEIINNNGSSEKMKLLALSLAKDCYLTRMQLLDSKVEVQQIMQSIEAYNEEQQRITLRHAYESANPGQTEYALSNRKF